MSVATSIILFAVGAILRFAVEPAKRIAGTNVNWDIIGDILMVAGAVGLVFALIWIATATRRGTRTIVEPTRPYDA
jgi:hypothetical protein